MHRLALRGAHVQIVVLLVCLVQITGISVSLLLESEVLLVVTVGVGSVVSSSMAAWLASGCTNIGPVLGRPRSKS